MERKKALGANPNTAEQVAAQSDLNRESSTEPETNSPTRSHVATRRCATSGKTSHSNRPQSPGSGENGETDAPIHNWKNLIVGQLPLQTETTTFILVNCLDIFLTYLLLTLGAIEANPIAAYFMQRHGFNGAIAYKLIIVTFVVVTAQVVAIKKLNTARSLLIGGTLLVGCVVVYSISLIFKHYL